MSQREKKFRLLETVARETHRQENEAKRSRQFRRGQTAARQETQQHIQSEQLSPGRAVENVFTGRRYVIEAVLPNGNVRVKGSRKKFRCTAFRVVV